MSKGDSFLLALFVAAALCYVFLIPPFEGPDESEHCHYIEAYRRNVPPHPLDPEAPLRWGYQVHHPPLYYWLVGQYAKVVDPAFPAGLTINDRQNPRFPFLRHDQAGRDPSRDRVDRGLRLLRLPSVLFGVVTFLALLWCFHPLAPHDPMGRRLLVGVAMLAPNTLHLCAVTANDGLNLLLSVVSVALGLRVVLSKGRPRWWFFLTGLCLGLAVWTKLTSLMVVATVATFWGLDAVLNRRWRRYLRGVPLALLPFAVLAGVYFAQNHLLYGSATREKVLWLLTRAFYRETPSSVFWILRAMAGGLPDTFAADLCWQSVHLPAISPLLFWPWLAAACCAVPLCWRDPGTERRAAPERLLAAASIFWMATFIVLANRNWGNVQFRHAWCLFPFTLLPLLDVRRWAARSGLLKTPGWLCLAVIGGLVDANAYLLAGFPAFRCPAPDTEHDRDYQTFLYSHVLNPNRARAYLLFGNFLTADYLGAFEKRKWQEAAALSKQAADEGQWPVIATYVRAFSLHAMGQLDEATELLLPLKDSYPPAYPLYARILIDRGQRQAARDYIDRMLPTCLPHEADELRKQLQALQGSPPDRPTGDDASGQAHPPGPD